MGTEIVLKPKHFVRQLAKDLALEWHHIAVKRDLDHKVHLLVSAISPEMLVSAFEFLIKV